jgi:hypothetical protein
MKAEELEASGMTPEAAQREARLRFGNLTKAKETTRDLHSFTSIESLLQDLRDGLSRLRHESAFALTAILTLGLVIGANGTIFSILEALLFRPLPLNNPSRLVVLFGSSRQSSRQGIPILDFEEFQKVISLWPFRWPDAECKSDGRRRTWPSHWQLHIFQLLFHAWY